MHERIPDWNICTSRFLGVSAGYIYIPLPRLGCSTIAPALRYGRLRRSRRVIGIYFWRKPPDDKRFRYEAIP